MEFKNRMRELRESKNLVPSQVAVQFKKSESAIRMWETGRSKPDADTLVALAAFFDVSTDYLLGLSNVRNPDYATTAEEIGLSGISIFKIKHLKDNQIHPTTKTAKSLEYDGRTALDVLNAMIEAEDFYAFIKDLGCLMDPTIDQWENFKYIDDLEGEGYPSRTAYRSMMHSNLDYIIKEVSESIENKRGR